VQSGYHWNGVVIHFKRPGVCVHPACGGPGWL